MATDVNQWSFFCKKGQKATKITHCRSAAKCYNIQQMQGILQGFDSRLRIRGIACYYFVKV